MKNVKHNELFNTNSLGVGGCAMGLNKVELQRKYYRFKVAYLCRVGRNHFTLYSHYVSGNTTQWFSLS